MWSFPTRERVSTRRLKEVGKAICLLSHADLRKGKIVQEVTTLNTCARRKGGRTKRARGEAGTESERSVCLLLLLLCLLLLRLLLPARPSFDCRVGEELRHERVHVACELLHPAVGPDVVDVDGAAAVGVAVGRVEDAALAELDGVADRKVVAETAVENSVRVGRTGTNGETLTLELRTEKK